MRSRSLLSFILVCLLMSLVVGLAGAADDPVTIRFNYRGGGSRTDLINEWIDEFESMHPHIRVEWQQPAADWQQKLIVGMAAGSAPDVTEIWGTSAQEMARTGLLLDLRPYVERDLTQEDIDDIYPPHWENAVVHIGPYKGQQFGMPLYTNTTVDYYNKSFFDQAGLEDPNQLDSRGEWTWSSLRGAADKLVQRSGDSVVRYGFSTDFTNWFRVVQYVWEAGGDWFDPEDPTRFIGDEPEAAEGMDFLHDMLWNRQTAMNPWNVNAFSTGLVAIQNDGLSELFTRHKPTIGDGFDWDIAPRAKGPAGRVPMTVDDALVIWKDSPHPDEAWEFVKYINSKEGQEIMVKHQGLAPTRRSALPAYLELDPDRNLGVVLDSMISARMIITSRTKSRHGKRKAKSKRF